ncbi:PREDICTED: cyclin-D1-binding protein 1 homolog [Acropora digitifera]|uniref:cyclin-D1-binding protein 1 homolog n=1 Tax=Acropora digitifera TaxID=70779 RepID=UPI00077AEAC2|nr:PREDICTED: cyclin-D1-binding protein 1 homolog [Acropora digitifera]
MAASEIAVALQSLIDTLELCAGKIKEGSLGQVMEDLELSFSLEEFWLKLGMTTRAVSKEATKLTVSFSKPPAPSVDELQCLLTGFETSVIAMLTIFRSLPLSQGRSLYKKLQESVITVVEDCQALTVSFIKEGCSSVACAKTKSTGTLWEHCDNFQNLPRDNKHAVIAVLHSNSELVKDALSELSEAQKSNGCQSDDDEDKDCNKKGWSDEDRLLVPPCIGLVKACRSCIKKVTSAIQTSGQVTSTENIQQLDEIADEILRTSPRVDDLVLSLYWPMNHQNVLESATKLSQQLKDLLEKARNSHFTVDSDLSWLDFLTKAIDHNFDKLVILLKERGGTDA